MEVIHGVSLKHPDAIALESKHQSLTFASLWGRIRVIAAALVESGVRAGDRVAIWGVRTPDFLATALSVMAIRASYVPLEPTYPLARLKAIVSVAGARLVAHDAIGIPAVARNLGVRTFDVSSVTTNATGLELKYPVASDVAYVIFTSGSTGAPKGVMIEHRSLLNYAAWCAAVASRSGQGSPLFGSLAFDLSMTSMWPALLMARRIVLSGGAWDRETLFDIPRPYTLMKLTPSHLRFFERIWRPDYRRATRLLIVGGEALDASLVTSLGQRLSGVKLMNHYGPTETTVGCCYYPFDSESVPDLPIVPIGRPVWNTRAYLVNENLDPTGPGREAELVIAGHGVARGYVGQDGSDRFIDESSLGGPVGRAYRTGDMVELLPSGQLMYLGRRDSQLKINAYRVELGELRGLALKVDGVADVAFDIRRGDVDVIEAFVVPAGPDGAADELAASVRSALAAELPPAVVPRVVRVVPHLVLNANGKCDISATRRLLGLDTAQQRRQDSRPHR